VGRTADVHGRYEDSAQSLSRVSRSDAWQFSPSSCCRNASGRNHRDSHGRGAHTAPRGRAAFVPVSWDDGTTRWERLADFLTASPTLMVSLAVLVAAFAILM
jgi:hypothetical protein